MHAKSGIVRVLCLAAVLASATRDGLFSSSLSRCTTRITTTTTSGTTAKSITITAGQTRLIAMRIAISANLLPMSRRSTGNGGIKQQRPSSRS